jgi:hypothetical protein
LSNAAKVKPNFDEIFNEVKSIEESSK